jgi:lysophospholipase L1-like esterase
LISTRGEGVEPKFHTWNLAKGQHTLRVAPAGDGPVTVYGMVLELTTSGVILDQLGIPGMRADIVLRWQEDTWGAMLARRKPDLVVLAYGTNDIGDVDEPIETYMETWRKVLTRLKNVNPTGSCLLVGPTDRLGRDELGHKRTLPRTAAVIAAQQQIAAQFGCGHWDAAAAMGGPGAMKRWQRAHLATADDVHLTRDGYTWLAELFEFALLREPRVGRQKRAAAR